MKDINDVYDVIDVMRRRHDLSIRRLAICANIAPTTLVSMMQRRPAKINKNTLISISNVFNVNWYELLNKTESFAYQHTNDNRILAFISKEDAETIKSKLFQMSNNTSVTYNDHILFLTNKLNENGVIEVMKRILDVVSDPQYRKEIK